MAQGSPIPPSPPMTSEQGEDKGGPSNEAPCISERGYLSKFGKKLAVARKQREERLGVQEKAQQGDTGSPPKHNLADAYDLDYSKPLSKKVFVASGRSLVKTRYKAQ